MNLAGNLHHEIGHYFELFHTHQAPNWAGCEVNDDCIADTVKDNGALITLDAVAQFNYGTNFNNLTAGEQQKVSNTYFNAMSYYNHSSHWAYLNVLRRNGMYVITFTLSYRWTSARITQTCSAIMW